MQATIFKRSLVALAIAGAFGLGAVAGNRDGATPVANAATAPAAAPIAPATRTTMALPDFADLVAKHGAAVVEVSVTRGAPRAAGRAERTPRGLPPELAPFFRGMPQPDGPSEGPEGGHGTGSASSSAPTASC
jgi:S1-C subfamily serine protease